MATPASQPLSSAERSALAAILDPSSPPTLHPADLPAFLDRPQVRAAIEARLRLMETRVRIQHAEASSLALGSLRAILETKPDLKDPIARTEVRRAATSILRFRFSGPPLLPSTLHTHPGSPGPLARPTAPLPVRAAPAPRAGAAVPASIHTFPGGPSATRTQAAPPAPPRSAGPARPGRNPPAPPASPVFHPPLARADHPAASPPADRARSASQLLARAGSADTG